MWVCECSDTSRHQDQPQELQTVCFAVLACRSPAPSDLSAEIRLGLEARVISIRSSSVTTSIRVGILVFAVCLEITIRHNIVKRVILIVHDNS